MAFICNKGQCAGCSHYRMDEDEADRMACYVKQDDAKIRGIILDVWDANQQEWRHGGDGKLKDFRLWVSYVMCYGFSDAQILEFAAIRGIVHDPLDCDPDDAGDHYGALVLTEAIINDLRKEAN